MSGATLLIRTDASASIGTGHVMRCLALAQAWQDAGGRAAFAMAESTPAIRQRLLSESCEVLSPGISSSTEDDARQTVALAVERGAEWVAVDSYQFGVEYQQSLKAAGLQVLFLDDYGHAEGYCAAFVLNQNVCATEALYENRESHVRLLLGPRYCPLRREFNAKRHWKREIPPLARRVLVTMGGSDPRKLTPSAIAALRMLGTTELEAIVVVGGSNPHYESLCASAAQSESRSGTKLTIQRDVSDMSELMTWADVAVSAAGSTCWELCFLGLPAILIDVAENQSALARELDRLGCAIHLGGADEASATRIAQELERLVRSEDRRQSLSRRCRQLVDGNGARRVVAILRSGLRLRRARADDARMLWEWANDPDVRSNSFTSDAIPWETHVKWLAEKLGETDCLMLIAEDKKGIPVGQIRFDATGTSEPYVNISIAREARGRGLATLLVEMGVEEVFGISGSSRVHALVKPENTASLKVFDKAGFIRTGVEQVRGNAAVHFTYDRK